MLEHVDPTRPFDWHDGDRRIRFGRGALARAPELLDEPYALLTTPRAEGDAPALVAGAERILHVPAGAVPDAAGALRADVARPGFPRLLVALGGGRVIDAAKALAAAEPPRRVAAVPTTLSAAEMTSLHRHVPDAPPDARQVRPILVVNDPALAASQPDPGLTASACNALGHAVEAPFCTRANPVATLAAHAAARLIVAALGAEDPDRDALALGALLSGYAIDSTGLGLHHVLAQTLVRETAVGHGSANAAMLPHSLRALGRRMPGEADALSAAAGTDLRTASARLAARAGAARLRDLGVARDALPGLAAAAGQRPQLANTPPAADREELLALYEEAW